MDNGIQERSMDAVPIYLTLHIGGRQIRATVEEIRQAVRFVVFAGADRALTLLEAEVDQVSDLFVDRMERGDTAVSTTVRLIDGREATGIVEIFGGLH